MSKFYILPVHTNLIQIGRCGEGVTIPGAEIFNAENEMSTRLAALMAANDNPENQITVVYSDRPAVVSLNGV